MLGHLFKHRNDFGLKVELVILLKPTIVRTGRWEQELREASERIEKLEEGTEGRRLSEEVRPQPSP